MNYKTLKDGNLWVHTHNKEINRWINKWTGLLFLVAKIEREDENDKVNGAKC